MFQDVSEFKTSFPCFFNRMWGVLHLHLLQLSPQSQSDLGFRDIDKPFLMGIESARLPSRHIYSWPADNLMTTMTIHTYMRMRFHVCPCVGRDLMRSCPLRVRVQWPPDALSVEWPRPETPLRLSVWRSGIHVDRFIVYIYIYICLCRYSNVKICGEGKISIYFRRMHWAQP